MRRPVRAWLVMIVLTAVTALAFNLGAPIAAPLVWLGALGLVTVVKGRLILLDYLELRQTDWRGAAIASLVFASALITLLLVFGNS